MAGHQLPSNVTISLIDAVALPVNCRCDCVSSSKCGPDKDSPDRHRDMDMVLLLMALVMAGVGGDITLLVVHPKNKSGY